MTAEDILLSKSWNELNSDEKTLVKDLASDEMSFNHMKQFMQQVGQLSSHSFYEPSEAVKTRLDSVFTNQHASRLQTAESVKIPAAKVVPLYQRNWTKVAAAAVFVLTAVLVWTWPGRQQIAPATKIAKMEEPVVFSDWNPNEETKDAATEDNKKAETSPADLKKEADLEESPRAAENTSERKTMETATVSLKDLESTAERGNSYRYLDEAEASAKPAAKVGLTADLFPNNCPNSVGASSEALLSYIKPAF